jgi:hypothetical protein
VPLAAEDATREVDGELAGEMWADRRPGYDVPVEEDARHLVAEIVEPAGDDSIALELVSTTEGKTT